MYEGGKKVPLLKLTESCCQGKSVPTEDKAQTEKGTRGTEK